MEGKKIIAHQTEDDQRKPQGVALEKSVKSVAEKTYEQEEVEESKNVIKHERLPCSCSNIGPRHANEVAWVGSIQ